MTEGYAKLGREHIKKIGSTAGVIWTLMGKKPEQKEGYQFYPEQEAKTVWIQVTYESLDDTFIGLWNRMRHHAIATTNSLPQRTNLGMGACFFIQAALSPCIEEHVLDMGNSGEMVMCRRDTLKTAKNMRRQVLAQRRLLVPDHSSDKGRI